MRYTPEYDGIRALAAVAVVLFHSAPHGPLRGGFVGVDLFFVLSAFLISAALAEDSSLGRFYWRRLCRLAPALFLMLAAYLVIAPLIWPNYRHWADAIIAASYVADYSYPALGVPLYLQHTWSLAVEEQFYLIWPPIFAWLSRSQRPALILLGPYIALTAWRCAWPWPGAYYRFDTHSTGLLLGAMLFFARPKATARLGYAALAALALIALSANIVHSQLAITAAELAAALLICAPPPWLGRLAWLGRRSYAIYLWHFPIVYVVRQQFGFLETAAITLALSIGAASVSFITVERWGRALRTKDPGSVRGVHAEHSSSRLVHPPIV